MLFFLYCITMMNTTKCDGKYNELLSNDRDLVVSIQNTFTYSFEGLERALSVVPELWTKYQPQPNLGREDTLSKVGSGMPNAFLACLPQRTPSSLNTLNHTHESLCPEVILLPRIKLRAQSVLLF